MTLRQKIASNGPRIGHSCMRFSCLKVMRLRSSSCTRNFPAFAPLPFLKKREAVFANYIIDDVGEAWWDKWQIKAIPIVLVFDREGQLVRKFDKDDPDNQFSYEDVEKLVAELLQQAPAKRSS